VGKEYVEETCGGPRVVLWPMGTVEMVEDEAEQVIAVPLGEAPFVLGMLSGRRRHSPEQR
jgi:hypothetical protein